MSPIRASAYGEMMFVNDMSTMNPCTSAVQLESSSAFNPVTSTPRASRRLHSTPVSRKRRSPNAFILFRSYYIANKRVPPEIVHQNDVSRYVAEVWKTKLTPSDRAVFFKMAEEEKIRFEIEGPREPTKKRRSRSKKTRQSSSPKSTIDACLPLSPTSASDISFPVTGTSSSSLVTSPQIYSSPEIYPTTPDSNGSVSLSAPQPKHAIPPSLLNWGSSSENHFLNHEGQTSGSFQYLTQTTAFPAADDGVESYVPLMDLDFNLASLSAGFVKLYFLLAVATLRAASRRTKAF
ncbi:uncharacterized protein FOMMEDRAFT_130541 [Fomitiporia mediterranea MF3/22]|uniref:uncharacterized protein n=1 Tax=Fomitiporia mediterranea (strain MF3/22) TaxID=694068 RepID=UPI0004408FFD|nr:uncharacterized protein FOMMEDRAFT_130541 [Fomitiporia mediterranea MF3/22]EJD07324.1 hypothetical protein FOMMEDRAFT_130541 [Fomitiporia mediterranea MF3/22]